MFIDTASPYAGQEVSGLDVTLNELSQKGSNFRHEQTLLTLQSKIYHSPIMAVNIVSHFSAMPQQVH